MSFGLEIYRYRTHNGITYRQTVFDGKPCLQIIDYREVSSSTSYRFTEPDIKGPYSLQVTSIHTSPPSGTQPPIGGSKTFTTGQEPIAQPDVTLTEGNLVTVDFSNNVSGVFGVFVIRANV